MAQYADEAGIALFTFTAHGVVSPANALAEQLLSASPQQQQPQQQQPAAGQELAKRKRADAPAGAWSSWSTDEVATWLESAGFAHYIPCFSMVEGGDLKELTADDLAGLPPPVISAFVAKKLLAAIAKL